MSVGQAHLLEDVIALVRYDYLVVLPDSDDVAARN
jgi:hypothetical protein